MKTMETSRPLVKITDRELQVARRLCAPDEPTVQVVARELGVTRSTIDEHLTRLYRKLGVHTRLGMYRMLTETLDIHIP